MCATVLSPSRTVRSSALNVELFATNLHAPTHMEWSLDGRLLVSEHTAGQITDISAGGDFRDSKPVAFGLQGPSSILQMHDGRILVSEMWSGRISDISAGGDVSAVEPFAEGLKGPYSLSMIGGSVYVVEHPSSMAAQVTEIVGKTEFRPYVTNVPGVPLSGMEGLTPPNHWPDRWTTLFNDCNDWKTPVTIDGTEFLALNSSIMGLLIKVPAGGGDYNELIAENSLFAKGLGQMGGMIQRPGTNDLYLTLPREGSVIVVDLLSENTDYRFTPPIVRGLNMPSCVRFSPSGDAMYICSFAVGGVWKVTGWD